MRRASRAHACDRVWQTSREGDIMVRSFFQTLCAARNQGAWLRWLLGVWCDCKTSQPRRAVGAGGAARGSPSDRAWTERHGCWARSVGETTRINARRRRRRRSWRWRRCAEGDAPAYPRRRDDETQKNILGKLGQAVNHGPFARLALASHTYRDRTRSRMVYTDRPRVLYRTLKQPKSPF